MSQLAHAAFADAPAQPADGPAPRLDAPLAPEWTLWLTSLTRLAGRTMTELRARRRRARRVSVTLTIAGGRVLTRSLPLARPTDRLEDVLPAASGLLRLMLAEAPGRVVKLGVQLEELIEGANEPIRFERYLARRKRERRRGWLGWFGLGA